MLPKVDVGIRIPGSPKTQKDGGKMALNPRIYQERVDGYFLEVYTKRPYIRFRHIKTGRFVKRPPEIYIEVVVGAETGGGGEPLEVEGIGVMEIPIPYLEKVARIHGPEQVEEELDRAEDNIKEHLEYEIMVAFGDYIAGMLEKKKRELKMDAEPGGWIKYRHPKRYTTWKVMEISPWDEVWRG